MGGTEAYNWKSPMSHFDHLNNNFLRHNYGHLGIEFGKMS